MESDSMIWHTTISARVTDPEEIDARCDKDAAAYGVRRLSPYRRFHPEWDGSGKAYCCEAEYLEEKEA
jgi:hypothetical protein